MKKFLSLFAAGLIAAASMITVTGCGKSDKKLTLRVCNWEEYIDLGGWDEEDRIDLDSGDIFGGQSIIKDFEEWFNSNNNYDYQIKVEYSTFGTNEDLYNRLSLGDVYDLVCPSEYLIMKLLNDGGKNWLEPYSQEFLTNGEYTKNVSPYIAEIFAEHGWTEYAACYMWGTTGLVYNPDEVEEDDVRTWNVLLNRDYNRRVTVKDNVRDAYFATLGIINSDELKKGGFTRQQLSDIMNDTDGETVEKAQAVLKDIKKNVYSFETDAGKADMVTGKVVANYQWSGDAVYIMDEADKDGAELWYAVPDECANLWLDGWIMLKDGIGGDARKKEAAEAFVNYVSRPESAIRNMNYIGYTSSIATDKVFEYLEWNYAADEDAEETYEYDLSYFFGSDEYKVVADAGEFKFDDDGKVNRGRQLFSQYPPENVIERSVIMLDFGERLTAINRMWINVRCPDLKEVKPAVWITVSLVSAGSALAICLYVFRYRIFKGPKPKKGYVKAEE